MSAFNSYWVMKANGGHGTLHVWWQKCPKKECASHDWATWDIEFDEEHFRCGTCRIKLSKPFFHKAVDE